jgi:hypothetical protein
MKKLNSLLAGAACAGLFMLQACSTANLVAYKTATTTQITVEAAMTVWGDYVKGQDAAGTPVSMDKRDQVKSAYEKYQMCAVVVADAGAGYTQAQSSTNATGAQAVLNTAIAIAGTSLADLVNLIRSFGVKI